MHSTLYINTGLVGTRDIMTWSQLEDFADAGHELGGHTAHHTGLTEVSETKARAEIKADVDALQAHGFPARSRSRTPTVTGETRRQSGSGTRATPTHAPPTSIGSRIRQLTRSACGSSKPAWTGRRVRFLKRDVTVSRPRPQDVAHLPHA